MTRCSCVDRIAPPLDDYNPNLEADSLAYQHMQMHRQRNEAAASSAAGVVDPAQSTLQEEAKLPAVAPEDALSFPRQGAEPPPLAEAGALAAGGSRRRRGLSPHL